MDEDLRQALARIDPSAAGHPVEPVGGPRARVLLEAVMSTPVDELRDSDSGPAAPVPARKRWALAAAAGLAVVAGAAGVTFLGGDDDPPQAPDRAATTLALSLPDPTVMASCLMFDEAVLAQMPLAFAGTVTAVEGAQVSLDVDRWFRAPQGEADTVELRTVGGSSSVALDGVEFTQGKRFLVTATDSTVNGCGFSGPATPELEGSFERAFK